MTRFQLIDPAAAEGKAKTLLDAVKSKMGLVPNMTRVMANAPAALDAYLQMSGALAGGTLNAKVREQIALTVGETNLCGYCLSAHTLIGGKVGLPADEIASARRATSSDAKTAALLKFARALVLQKGEVSDAAIAETRAAGAKDGELLEVVANVALNIYTNYVNHVAKTAIDFPEVKPGV